MEKLIKITNDEIVLVTLEEAIEIVMPAIKKAVRITKNDFNEYEDLQQTYIEWVIKAFHKYDVEKGKKWSTLAIDYIKSASQKMDNKENNTLKAQEGKKYVKVNLDYTFDDGNSAEELYGYEDENINKIIEQGGYYGYILEKYRNDVQALDIIVMLVGESLHSVATLGEKYNISRQGMHKKVTKFKQILQQDLQDYMRLSYVA